MTTYTVGVDGRVADCRIEAREGWAEKMTETGDFRCTPTPRVQPYRDASGAPVRKRVRSIVQFEVEPAN